MKYISLCCIALLLSLFLVAQSDTMATEQWRPVYHFTPPKNWTNDPNGLIYVKGVYQLYNQQNPYENKWGHMSWGHATSLDLLHWKHYPVAMPEAIDNKDTTWRFSGCVVNDKHNTSGFCKNESCLVAIYTAHQPNRKRESQYIAYSNDSGITYTQYENNPVIDLNKEDFRDPNVQWDDANKRWLMVVAVPFEHKVQFYSSADLKEWKLLSEFGNQGVTDRVWECPSFIELPVDENVKTTKWALLTSVGGKSESRPFMQYFIGDWDGNTFTNLNKDTAVLKVDDGNTFYAAIPYNDAPQKKEILLGWMIPVETKTSPWRGQMSVPRDLLLRTTPNGIRLYQQPASVITKELDKLPLSYKQERKNITIENNEIALNTSTSFNSNTNWIEVVFVPGSATRFGFWLTQSKDKKKDTKIAYDVAANEVTVTAADGSEVHSLRSAIKPVHGKIKMQILLDKSSLEVFLNDGEKVITTYVFPGADATGFSLFSEGGTATAETIKMYNVLNP